VITELFVLIYFASV